MNSYLLALSEYEAVSFKRWANTTLKQHNLANIFGTKPSVYNHNFYLTSSLIGIKTLQNSSGQASFALSLQSSVVTINTELKKTTVFSIFSALGGAIALVLQIYARLCRTLPPHRSVQDTLDARVVALDNERISLEELGKRQKALESFLHDYLDGLGYFASDLDWVQMFVERKSKGYKQSS